MNIAVRVNPNLLHFFKLLFKSYASNDLGGKIFVIDFGVKNEEHFTSVYFHQFVKTSSQNKIHQFILF